jgi:hypothetical protein
MGPFLKCSHRWWAVGQYHIRRRVNNFRRATARAIEIGGVPASIGPQILPLCPAQFSHYAKKNRQSSLHLRVAPNT